MLSADHPNAAWLREMYTGGEAIEADPNLSQDEKQARMAEHLRKITERFSPDFVVHTGGIKTAAVGGHAFAMAYGAKRKQLTEETFRPVDIKMVIADDQYGILDVSARAEVAGREFLIRGIGVWRFEEGLLVEHWEVAPGQMWDEMLLTNAPDFEPPAEEYFLKSSNG
jgi:hypothetical protein